MHTLLLGALAVTTPYVPLTSLWLPILIAAVLVWIVSALFWTVSPHHKKDFAQLPNETRAMTALREAGVQPGHYSFPFAGDQATMKDPEFQKKLDAGPVGMLTVATADMYRNMGKPMILSFVYYVAISFLVAYVASRTLPPGTEYLHVFRVVGTIAFLAYAAGIIPDTIWFGRGWTRAWKHVFDAFVYGMLTAGAFGWRWPGM